MIDPGIVIPTREDFAAQVVDRAVVPVRCRLMADDLTPVALYAQLCGGRSGTFLFESAEQGVWSRWSYVGVNAAAT